MKTMAGQQDSGRVLSGDGYGEEDRCLQLQMSLLDEPSERGCPHLQVAPK